MPGSCAHERKGACRQPGRPSACASGTVYKGNESKSRTGPCEPQRAAQYWASASAPAASLSTRGRTTSSLYDRAMR